MQVCCSFDRVVEEKKRVDCNLGRKIEMKVVLQVVVAEKGDHSGGIVGKVKRKKDTMDFDSSGRTFWRSVQGEEMQM